MNTSISSDGDLAWIYVDITAEGTNNYEFVFKVINKGESDLTFDDLSFVDCNGNSYNIDDISINKTTIKVNKKNTSFIFIGIIAVVIILILAVIVSKTKKK
jgi:hypothetical protein